MNKHYLIVLNPKPNRKKKYWLEWLVSELKKRKYSFHIYTTAQALSDNQLYFNTHLHKFSEVIALGGDGTLHMLANCLAYSNKPLAILPCGTGNDFMRNFSYSKKQLKHLVFSEKVVDIALGKVNNRFFINIAGIGFDTDIVVSTMHDKGPFAKASYLYKAAKALFIYQSNQIKVFSHLNTNQYSNFLTIFANGQYFGGGMKVAPKANVFKSEIDCYQIHDAPLIKKLIALALIFKGKHVRLKEVNHLSQQVFSIQQVGLPVEADGELIGTTPIEVGTAANALRLKCL